MINHKQIQVWLPTTGVSARIWLCSKCGAKVFYSKPVTRPSYRCSCGTVSWQTFATIRKW